MNKSAQAMGAYLLMIGIVIVILALAFAPVLKESVDSARGNSTDESLDCSDITNDWQRGTCFASDLFLPYFFIGIIGIGLAIIGAKIIL